jgi:phosphohistidine phosphatase
VRHAKAVPDPPAGGADHDRALAPSGRRDAEALGRRLAGDRFGFAPGDLPAVALCSTARRTAQTAEAALAGVGTELDLRRSLYQATPDEVLDEVRTVDDEATAVMVVGHNPTVHRLAIAMIADDDEASRRALRDRFPTCGVAVYRLRAERWRDVAAGTGTVAGWFAPPFE